jgi:HEAT repeat protein
MPLFGPPNVEKMKAKKDVEGLIKALSHEKSFVIRWPASVALGDIGDPRAVGPLIVLLKDADSIMRSSAAESLGKIGDTRSVEPLIAALQDKDSHVREAASEALGKIGEPAVKPLVAALKDADVRVSEKAAELLGKIGEPAVEPLIASLKGADSDSNVRERAAKTLGIIGNVHAVEPLNDTLKDKDARVRGFAADALGLIGDARAVEPLCAALNATLPGHFSVHESICEALGKIGDARAVNPLITALQEAERVRAWVYVRALEKIGTIEAKESLVAYEKRRPKLPARLQGPLPEHVYVGSSGMKGDPGSGGSEFQAALSDWNADRYEQAAEHYLKAIDLGLTSVYEAASRSNLGKIYLMQDDVISAVDQFIKGLYLSPLTASTAYSCSTYLALIYEELGMRKDELAAVEVAKAALKQLDSVMSAEAANKVRATVRRVYK